MSLDGTHFMDFKIVLKNGEIIDKRLKGGSDEYAKAMFLELKFKGTVIDSCGEGKSVGTYIILLLDVIVAIIIYFDKTLWYMGIVMFIVSSFYFTNKTESSYETKLCKKTKKLFDELK